MYLYKYLFLFFFTLLLNQGLVAHPIQGNASPAKQEVLKQKKQKKNKRPNPKREWNAFWIFIFIFGTLLLAGVLVGLAYLFKAVFGIGLGFGFLITAGLFIGIFLLWRLIKHIKKKKKEKRIREAYE